MKISIICFDFKESNIKLQPWKFFYEISKGMLSMNMDVHIITNGPMSYEDNIDGINIYHLKEFRSFPFVKNNELIRLINEKSPDIILWMIGESSFYLNNTLKNIDKPIIGIWTETIYSIGQITNLGYREIIRNFGSIKTFIIRALTPSSIKKSIIKSSNLKRIVVLNNNCKRLVTNFGFPPNCISVIPPGITNYDLEFPDIDEVEKLKKKIGLDKNSFAVLYFGSPLSLRGIDTLIEASSIVYKKISQFKLIILSRRHSNDLLSEENFIMDLCKRRKIDKDTYMVSGFLNRDEIKTYIVSSDIVALPFKLVQSDSPLSILEVMALGKPLISTKIDGIPDMLEDDRGYQIDPNDPMILANSILALYYDRQLRNNMGERAREYMLRYPVWDKTVQDMLTIINDVTCQRYEDRDIVI